MSAKYRKQARVAPRLASVLLACVALPSVALAQVATADLAVSQTLLSAPVQGGNVSVRITLRNVGGAPAGSITLIGGVGNAALNTIGGGGASCAKGRNSVYTCILPGLAAGASVDLLETARIDTTALTFTSNAQVSGDSNTANNAFRLVADVATPPPDLAISGSASTRQPDAGAPVDFRFQVKANGKQAALGVAFVDALPAELTLLGASSSTGGGCEIAVDNVVRCALGDIPGGGQSNVTISALAPSSVGTTLANTGVALAADGLDAVPSNNSLTLEITTR